MYFKRVCITEKLFNTELLSEGDVLALELSGGESEVGIVHSVRDKHLDVMLSNGKRCLDPSHVLNIVKLVSAEQYR